MTRKPPSLLSIVVGVLSVPFLLRAKPRKGTAAITLPEAREAHLTLINQRPPRVLKPFSNWYRKKPASTKPHAKMKSLAGSLKRSRTMLNPLSWSLDDWFTALQLLSAIILVITVIVGRTTNRRQAEKI